MRFNFITIYFDRVIPTFSLSPSSKNSVVCLRGATEPITTSSFSTTFSPIFASFNSNDFSVFSKNFKLQNSYLSNYFARNSRLFGSYSDLSMYSQCSVTSTFEKNIVLYKVIKNFRYNSIIFRSNGFRIGSLAFGRVSITRSRFFQFFRNFSFYNLFARVTSLVFIHRGPRNKLFFKFLLLFRTFFFRYFINFRNVAGSRVKIFKRFNRQKISFLKHAFLLFFLLRRSLNFNGLFFIKGFQLTNFPSFYLSEAVFFSSRLGFQRRALRRYMPLVFYLRIKFLSLMPQLDLFSLGNQFFWGVIFFVVFYFLVSYYVIPSVFSIMFARTFYVNKLSDDSIKLIAFCFVFSSIASIYYSDILNSIQATLESSYTNKFVYNIALGEFVDLEISEVYDNSFFNDDEKQ